MAHILCIESSGKYSSLALFKDEELQRYTLITEERSHSKMLASAVNELLQSQEISPYDLDALAISAGPGSYTGLRIGVSLSKGICFAADIPLIAINSLKLMALKAEPTAREWTCPMIDARRMEVYMALYDENGKEILSPSPHILDQSSFQEYSNNHPILFVGDGALKSQQILRVKNGRFEPELFPSADYMGSLALSSYHSEEFVNIDTFEPEYLKPVYTTKPKAEF